MAKQPPLAPQIVAGGGVVYRQGADGPQFVIAHRRQYDDWSIPKGKLDRGESVREAAEREVWEETGYKCKVGQDLGTVSYYLANGRRKMVRYWLMEAKKGKFRANREIDRIKWVSPSKAKARLNYSRDRSLLDWAVTSLDAPGSGRIYLVRHANAVGRGTWTGPDHPRPLDKLGEAQSIDVSRLLTRQPVTRIITSPYLRCSDTVVPLGKRLDLKVETDERLGEGTSPKALGKLLAELAGEAAVLCSHGDVIGDALGSAAADGAKLGKGLTWEKGSTWLLTTRKGKIKSGRYRKPGARR